MNMWEVANRKGSSLAQVLAARTDQTNNDVVDCCACRIGLLRVLAKRPGYKKRAKEELRIKRFLASGRRSFEKHCSTYPPILQNWRVILKAREVGIFDVSYPSQHALERGKDNYVAIAGDGLLDFLFEVITLEGDGKFRLVRRFNTKAYPRGRDYETEDVKRFMLHAKCSYDDILTGNQIADYLAMTFDCPMGEAELRSMVPNKPNRNA